MTQYKIYQHITDPSVLPFLNDFTEQNNHQYPQHTTQFNHQPHHIGQCAQQYVNRTM